MKPADLVKRVDELIEMSRLVLATQHSEYANPYTIHRVKTAPMAGFRSACLSFIDRVYGAKHPHFIEFTQEAKSDYVNDAERGAAILSAIRSEIAGGWLFTMKGLVAAELFSDFIEMAEHLLESGYKDAAAVMAGSVLEEHLRQLCHKSGIAVEEVQSGRVIPFKADTLNAVLYKADVYTKLDQKAIVAWLDLRNHAAHGKCENYNDNQVKQLIGGVTEFIARVPM